LGRSAAPNLSTKSAAAVSASSTTPTPSSSKTVIFPTVPSSSRQGETKRVPMTSIRKRIAERLVQSQQSTATLTTFNEIDMTSLLEIRARHKDKFKEKYGLSLGFMGFFVKASIEALKNFPAVNAFIDGQDLIYNNFYNIGVAVGTEKGLIVPVIKDADRMSIAQIENSIRNFATKARDGKISVDDLSGGTFTISNGGVYGSLLSTPILNPPQSGILGMHKIEERAVVVNSKIEIRSRMYVALSYDHRVIDGKEAVSFLVKIKEGIEDPERLLLEV
ncbi:MAG: dihydrolipoyllysine-residue succinyltransferase, partial [Bdellovibrio sp.]